MVRRLEVIYSEPEKEFYSAEEDSGWEDEDEDDDKENTVKNVVKKRTETENDSGVVV